MPNSDDTTTVLKQYSDKELAAEVERRELEQSQRQLDGRRAMVKKVLEHRDVLLEFVPHTRASCNGQGDTPNPGYHPDHGAARCTRCALLNLQEHNDEVDISISMQMTVINPKGRG